MKKIVFAFFLLLASQFATPKTQPDFDRLIVPGKRIGPVAMGGYVDEIVKKLGKPNKTSRSTFRGPGYTSDEVYYYYTNKNNDLRFTWLDEGLRPVVESGYRGITTTSGSWATASGVHVGSTIPEVVAAYGEPDNFSIRSKKESIMVYNIGINFVVKDRNSPVLQISIIPPGNYAQ